MLITVDRTSVAAGDDALPHARTIDVPAGTPLADVVAQLVAEHYLALIAGGRATWILTADRPLAVLAQQWDEPGYLVDPAQPIGALTAPEDGVSLRFRYWKQHDSDAVYAELAAGRGPLR